MNESINEVARIDDTSPHRTRRLEGPVTQPTLDDTPQVEELIHALGDPKHRAHRTAVNDLVALGPSVVPVVGGALGPDYPWLTSYRAAEALAQIGDGRATGALINALRHPNSNVRWSVVQALAEIGDSRSIMALRRVAREDRGKTSWGEAVADTAQLTLSRLQSRSILVRFWEPLKTILIAAAMIAALTWSLNQITDFNQRLRTPAAIPVFTDPSITDAEATATAQAAADGSAAPNAESSAAPSPDGGAVPGAEGGAAPAEGSAAPAAGASDGSAGTGTAGASASPEPSSAATSPFGADAIVARVSRDSNLRAGPRQNDRQLQVVRVDTQVAILGRSNNWLNVRLDNGQEGWIFGRQIELPPDVEIPNTP